MYQDRTAGKAFSLAFVLSLLLASYVQAQPAPLQGSPSQGVAVAAYTHNDDDDDDDDDDRRTHRMRGHGRGMGLHHLGWLAQRLQLNDEQQTQLRTVMHNHAKEQIRLKAELATMKLDLHALLQAEPLDLGKVKPQFQAMAAKKVDLQMAHVTAMQEMRKILTPEQQKQFKALHGDRMRHGGKREHGSGKE
ncbi:MAG: Spy/CpxP family protein refolding chaperone [Candidatus Tectimicrobiota bacterium]